MKKKNIWSKPILFLVLIVMLLSIGAGIMLLILVRQKQYDAQITLGEKYLMELDYENAELSFKKALEIKEKNAKPYLYLADIYTAQGDNTKAAEILRKGEAAVGGEIFRERMEQYEVKPEIKGGEIQETPQSEDTETVISDVLGIPYIGDEVYLLDIYKTSKGGPGCTSFADDGYISFSKNDFDNDGQEEILVITLRLDNAGESMTNNIYMVMLEHEEGTWIMSSEYKIASYSMEEVYQSASYINNSIVPYRIGFFCKEVDGIRYIFTEFSGYASAFATGTEWELQQYSYQDSKFMKIETGLYICGSDVGAELNLNPAEAYSSDYADAIQTMRDTLSLLELIPNNGVGYDNELMSKTDGIETLVQIEKKANVAVSELRYWDFETTINEAVQIDFTDYTHAD